MLELLVRTSYGKSLTSDSHKKLSTESRTTTGTNFRAFIKFQTLMKPYYIFAS